LSLIQESAERNNSFAIEEISNISKGNDLLSKNAQRFFWKERKKASKKDCAEDCRNDWFRINDLTGFVFVLHKLRRGRGNADQVALALNKYKRRYFYSFAKNFIS